MPNHHKRIIILVLPLLVHSYNTIQSSFLRQLNESTYQVTSDIIDAVNNNAETIGKATTKVSGEVAKGILSGSSQVFEPGGAFDQFISGQAGALNRNFGPNGAYGKIIFENYKQFAAIGIAVAGVNLTLQYGIPLFFKMLERYLTRPKLIIESSSKGWIEYITSYFSSKKPQPIASNPELKQQLDNTIKITQTIQKKIKEGKKNVKYRNLLLYGAPGTGKTMFAKELARQSGLEYAFMSGSSFSKFQDGQGIEALDELFAWANRSSGLMIFIDEAESFLSSRDKLDPQSKPYQLINNFLNYTGERSNKFMLVFATNHKDALDSAMYRRIDDLIKIPLPSLQERETTLNLYINKILLDPKQNDADFIESVTQTLTHTAVADIAEQTKGLSYGELEGIINNLKTEADILDPVQVTQELVDQVVKRAVQKYYAFTQGKYVSQIGS